MVENQCVNLSVIGGGDNIKYYVFGLFYNESFIYKNVGNIYGYNLVICYNKFNFCVNVDLNVIKSIMLNVNLVNIYEKLFGFGFGDNDNDIWSYIFNVFLNVFLVQYFDGILFGLFIDFGYNLWNMLVYLGYCE